MGFRVKSDLRNHQAIVQPRLYDGLMVTQITLKPKLDYATRTIVGDDMPRDAGKAGTIRLVIMTRMIRNHGALRLGVRWNFPAAVCRARWPACATGTRRRQPRPSSASVM